MCCGAAPDVGALCRPCAREVAPCDGLIPDHLRSPLDATNAQAWVVDGFGGAHAIAAKAVIGRNQGGDVVVLASSVSREHAELRRGETGWTVRDLGSRNGTFVDGARCQGRTALPGRAVLKIGDVALVMNGRGTVKDWVSGEPRHLHIGNHGGMSEDEMNIPLVVAKI